jgi:dCTP deaminase
MPVLVDHQIDQLLAATTPLATNVPRGDFTGLQSRIQAASLDLTIGDIFVPGAEPDKPGGLRSPHTRISLRAGHIAVIRTQESLALPNNLVAHGFPPSSLSIQGVLMTNPGHVDPGYNGPMHLTVINMSKEVLRLQRGDRIVRLIFARLDSVPSADYRSRHPGALVTAPPVGPITEELLQSLSPQVVDVEQRAKQVVEASDRASRIWSGVIAATVGIVVACFASVGPRLFDRYYALESGLAALAGKLNVTALEDRVKQLEEAAKAAGTTPGPAIIPPTKPASPPAQGPKS